MIQDSFQYLSLDGSLEVNSFQGLPIVKEKLYSMYLRCSLNNFCYGIYQKVAFYYY